MNKRYYKYFPWIFVLGDIFALFTALLVSLKISGQLSHVNINPQYLIFIVVWIGLTVFRKDYKIGRTTEVENTIKRLVSSLIWYLAIISILWMIIRNERANIDFHLSLATGLFLFIGIYRVAVHLLLKQYRKKGNNFRNAIIIGKGPGSKRLAEVFNKRKDFGINFLGYFDDANPCIQTRGRLSGFFDQAPKINLDLIYINDRIDFPLIKRIIDYADERYIKVKVIPETNLQLEKNLSFSQYGDFYVINVNEIPLDNLLNRFLKRTFDFIFSLFVCIFILSWLIPLVGLMIKLESKGSVFFVQKRNGVNNIVFNCLKFRSMTPNDYSDTKQAVKNDPRVTKTGAFLRSTSLDEMPQFINVLMGEMSVVGPRPHSVPMNTLFRTQIEKYNLRHKIKPGITGLAQIKGFRGEIENPHQIRSRVKLDYFYIKNWSIWMDLGICLKTVYELASIRENAY